jgi:opacity protein-like surface antigen
MYKVSKVAAGSVIAATAALGGASVALADGYSAPRVAYERPADWSGVYFGVSSGYQWSSIDLVSSPGGARVSVSDNDALVGAHLGLQHQFGAIVVGVEGGWQSTFRDEEGKTDCPVNLQCTGKLNDILSIGARAGWAMGRWMPYLTGGFASARFAHEVWSLPGVGGVQTLQNSASTRNNGWYLGGGLEWAISPGWSTGIEYRHYDFDSATGPAFTPTGVLVEPHRVIDPQGTDMVTARVSWRWGRPDAAPLK